MRLQPSSPASPLHHRIPLLAVLLVCLLAASPVCGQATDSVALRRELGCQLLRQKRYAEAYKAFDYCIKHTPAQQKNTADYSELQKNFHEAWNKVNLQLKRIHDEATVAQRKGQNALADSLFLVYLDYCVTPESCHDYDYSIALTQKALQLQRRGEVSDAIKLLEEVVAVRKKAAYIDDVHSAETLNLIAAAESQLGHYDAAIKHCREAAELYRKRYGTNHEHYGTTLSNLASYYTSRNAPGDRRKAVLLGEEAVDVLPKDKPAYAQALNSLVVYYSLAGDMVKAQKYSKAAIKVNKKLQTNTLNYASILSNQAVRLANANNYEQAAEFAREAIGIFEANGEVGSLNFARLLSNTASFEKHAEHYAEAIELWQRAASIFERIEGKGGSGYLDCMSEISAAHARRGNLEEAADINEQLQTTASEQADKGDARYAHSLTKRASILATDGNYQQAIVLVKQALDIFRLRKDQADMAASLKELSGYLHHIGERQAAIDTCLQALKLYEQLPSHDEDRALALNSLSIYYYSAGRYDEALGRSREAVAAFEKAGRTETSFFAKVLTNQALFESRRDSFAAALHLSRRADSIQRRVLGPIHPDNVMLLFNMANYHLKIGQKAEAQHLFHEALEMQMQHVRSNFSHLTTRGRELYWGTKSYIFRAAPFMASLMEDVDSARIDAYDAQLFTKGLLLNSEVDFRNLLARTASAELQEKYAELAAIHQQIEQAWRSPTDETRAGIPALTADASRLERELVRGCKEFGDFTESMRIGYVQVAGVLGEGDAAIEFFDIDTPVDGRTYWALLARKGLSSPLLIRLFCERDMEKRLFSGQPLTQALTNRDGIDAVFSDTSVGQLVWGRLIPHLSGVRNIWFAPSGLLYQWGIEYLRYDTRRIDEMFAIHRVSSTRLLAQQGGETHGVQQAAVFGGLDYDASPAELISANEGLSELGFDYLAAFDADAREDMALAETRAMEGLMRGDRKAVGYLEGSRVEAELIGEVLMQRDISTEMYEAAAGTEEAFKKLSGRGVSLLHIATHGFSLSEADVRRDAKAVSYLDAVMDEASQADNSLCYSGLLLSGANNVLSGKAMPKDLENGVLTAREISQLDLRSLDLAVLSACQTGLGELKEDGVFGLQRGFKKAGARTLLMSLWSVDDDATQLMMTSFYEALAGGVSRRAAFHAAQEAVRRDARYSSPFFWASFVMLDD